MGGGFAKVTISIKVKGRREVSTTRLVPDDLLDARFPGNDYRQNAAAALVSAAFTEVYQRLFGAQRGRV